MPVQLRASMQRDMTGTQWRMEYAAALLKTLRNNT